MSDPKAQAQQQEPSMEEILASIRRIISEDADAPGKDGAPKPQAAAPSPPPPPRSPPPSFEVAPDDGDVFDLTNRVADDGSMQSASGSGAFAIDFDTPMDLTDPLDDPAPERPSFSMDTDDFAESLMSSRAARSSANAFAALADLDEPEPEPEPMRHSGGVPTPYGLEELVKDALRPVLKEWLDQNLPPIVEELVRQEIQRVAQHGRRR
jgi:cell pole-organizing protein PopZ